MSVSANIKRQAVVATISEEDNCQRTKGKGSLRPVL